VTDWLLDFHPTLSCDLDFLWPYYVAIFGFIFPFILALNLCAMMTQAKA